MKTTIKIEKEVELKFLRVVARARYYEDATVNGVEDINGDLIPCKVGEYWCPIIDIENGVIKNWKQGVKAEVHYKVFNDGSYYLLDIECNTILSIETDYVPDIMCPGESNNGDYIIMNIDENGKINNWKPTLQGFLK